MGRGREWQPQELRNLHHWVTQESIKPKKIAKALARSFKGVLVASQRVQNPEMEYLRPKSAPLKFGHLQPVSFAVYVANDKEQTTMKLERRGRPRKRIQMVEPARPALTDEKALAELIFTSNIDKDTKLRLLGELL